MNDNNLYDAFVCLELLRRQGKQFHVQLKEFFKALNKNYEISSVTEDEAKGIIVAMLYHYFGIEDINAICVMVAMNLVKDFAGEKNVTARRKKYGEFAKFSPETLRKRENAVLEKLVGFIYEDIKQCGNQYNNFVKDFLSEALSLGILMNQDYTYRYSPLVLNKDTE